MLSVRGGFVYFHILHLDKLVRIAVEDINLLPCVSYQGKQMSQDQILYNGTQILLLLFEMSRKAEGLQDDSQERRRDIVL